MSETKTIYVVTKGTYEDYHIEAIFDDEETADRAAATFSERQGDCVVEEWPLNKFVGEIKKGYRPFSVELSTERDPRVFVTEAQRAGDGNFDFEANRAWSKWRGWAKDQEHAIKIAQDERAKAIAESKSIS